MKYLILFFRRVSILLSAIRNSHHCLQAKAAAADEVKEGEEEEIV